METRSQARRVMSKGKTLLSGALLLLLVGPYLARSQSAVAPTGVEGLTFSGNRTVAGPQSDDPWHSTQLHIHGWSNHNAGAYPASLQLHSDWAKSVGLDVIWWSEHNGVFQQNEDWLIDLDHATITNTLDIRIPIPPEVPWWQVQWYVGWLGAGVTGTGQPKVSLDDGVLRMSIKGDGPEFTEFRYRTLSYKRTRVGGHSFVRPLASRPMLNFDATLCGDSGEDAYAELEVRLSWHDYGELAPQELIYRLVPPQVAPAKPGPGLVSSPQSSAAGVTIGHRLTYTVPLDNTHVELPLLDHARPLLDGDDNAIQELYLRVAARNGAEACLEISNIALHSQLPESAINFASHQQVAQRHQATYGVIELTGWEQNSGLRHLNPYLPQDAGFLPVRGDFRTSLFVPIVHDHGGLVGLNHPFGAGYGDPLPADEQEQLLQDLLDTLLPERAWEIDLIEIYERRAQADLAHHLRLWDLLAVNGIPMCAVAASDQHGGPFTHDFTDLVTWIQAPRPEQDELLEGLRGCRAFFGHLKRFDGVIDLRLSSTVMGGFYLADEPTAALHVLIDPLPDDAEVRLVQVLEQPGRDLIYLVDHVPVDPSQPILVDTSRSSFVRVELWDALGRPVAFSNRIYIKRLDCDVSGDGLVDIVDVQLVAGVFGSEVPPVPEAYDLQRDGIINLWDTVLAAQCWVNVV